VASGLLVAVVDWGTFCTSLPADNGDLLELSNNWIRYKGDGDMSEF
jgi:hypothetical protein